MTKKQKNTNRLLKNKGIQLLIVIVIMLLFYTCNNVLFGHSHFYKKLQGNYNVIWEYTEIYRNTDFRPIASILSIKNNQIELPCLLSCHDKIEGEDFDKWNNNQKGTWKIISKEPDSILIETPASLLNGRYAVIFQKEEIFAKPPRYLLILQNDSTHLCFDKVIETTYNLDW
ncbi:MAG: hypothetical protein K6G73_05925 [Marinilabiliaceae bacterium]|nr:hypothetical protein [Marinilabiliaceae bacterium]